MVGTKPGRAVRRAFEVRSCDACRFAFVADPTDDFAAVYNEDYYAGRGADPLVNYLDELEHPDETVRLHEWRGTARLIGSLVPLRRGVRWLDFGCGTGGLVRHVRAATEAESFGYDVGWATENARARGTPVLTDGELAAAEGTFDVVTSIEVIEHVADPLPWLAQVRRLLRPGGVFFFTTGNTARHRRRLLDWSYVVPDLHVSFFDPANAADALRKAGLAPEPLGWRPGCAQVIRARVLKNLGVTRNAAWHDLVPWRAIAPAVNARFGVFEFPIGRA